MEVDIIEKELSYKIYGIFLKVGKEYGFFSKEELYQNACEEELSLAELKFESRQKIFVNSKKTNNRLGLFIPDLIVEDKIIVEIKALKILPESASDQLLKYLEFSKYEVGYLVNFGNPYTDIIRKVYSNSLKNLYNQGLIKDII